MIYNLNYLESMYRNYSATAKQICELRWNFIDEIINRGAHKILDYGCGCGYFRAFRPNKKELINSHDINKHCPQTGILGDTYDIICLWDVLEHFYDMQDINKVIEQYNIRFIALTVPIKPDNKKMYLWKHFKPGEHLTYFTHETISILFNGFKLIKKDDVECPPREDIWSFIFEKNNNKTAPITG